MGDLFRDAVILPTGPDKHWALILLCLPLQAIAGHPMLSEDTGTQGRNNVELELGYDWTRTDGRSDFLFQPQLSWGAGAAFDLIVQPSWLTATAPSGGRVRAFGDTNVDFKWRVLGSAPWSLGVRAGLELPTAQDHLQLPPGRVAPHAILVATGDYAPWTIDANAGLTREPYQPAQRRDLAHYSLAVNYAVNASLSLVVDTSLDSSPALEGTSYQAVALAGAIYTVHPGLDIDAGFRGRLDRSGPAQQFLLGITFRGSP